MGTASPQEKVIEAVLAYWRLADKYSPSAQELAEWFDGLSPCVQTQLTILSLEQALRLPLFKRYLLERRGLAMHTFMRAQLTQQEFSYWVDDADAGICPA
jgi:hypothetical protein